MVKSEIKNKSEFQKLFKINIPYENEFNYYVDTLCKSPEYAVKLPKLLSKFKEYESDIEKLGYSSVTKYKLDYVMPKLIDAIKVTKAYERLLEYDYSKFKLRSKDNYKSEYNDGAYFLSMDFSSANFSTLKLFDQENVFKNSWYEFCVINGVHPVLAESKNFRQYVYGNTHPKRIGKIQLSHIMKLVEVLGQFCAEDDYMFISNDEVIVRLGSQSTSVDDTANLACKFIKLIEGKSEYPVRTNIFKLDKIGKKAYIKTFYDLEDLESGVNKRVIKEKYKSIFGVSGREYYQYFKKYILQEKVEDRDLYFVDNNKLAKWLDKKEDEHSRLDGQVKVEGVNYTKIPKAIRKRFPGISDIEIHDIMKIFFR